MPTEISWTDETLNFATGCTKVTTGCDKCYMFRQWPRLKAMCVRGYSGRPDQVHIVDGCSSLNKIDKWRRPRRIFINSMSDTFHRDVPFSYVRLMLEKALNNPRHTLQVLTKRPGRAVAFWEWLQRQGWTAWPDNVWLGVSISTAKYLPWLDVLARVPAAVRFVSLEPLLSAMDLKPWLDWPDLDIGSPSIEREYGLRERLNGINWVIVGGESGPGFRPMDIAWVHGIVDQCQFAEVPVFVKQDSGIKPGQQGRIPDSLWSLKEMPA